MSYVVCPQCSAHVEHLHGTFRCPHCDLHEQHFPARDSITPQSAAPRDATPAAQGLATASMVLGILGLTSGLLFGSIAIFLASSACKEMDRRHDHRAWSMARAGRVMGWISVWISIILIIVAVVFVYATRGYWDDLVRAFNGTA